VSLAPPPDPRAARRELVVVGLDHTTAGIELRERMAFAAGQIAAALARLTDPSAPLLEQAAILSTCNRVELYGVARARPEADALAAFLARFHGVGALELSDAMYIHRAGEVAHHLAATAAGMHSLVPGEAQVQGQVRAALDLALAAGTAGPELRRLFESAISAGRRVRSRTAIGRGVASVPHAAVDLARERLGTLRGSSVLLIGAGAVNELAAKHLVKHGVRELLLLGRDPGRAERLAERYGGRVLTLDTLHRALARCNVAISATGAPRWVVQRDQVARAALARRRSAPLVVIDLAVPRDVDPSVAGLAGVELYTLDDLRAVVDRTLARRRAELPAAQSVVCTEVARFTSWLSRRHRTAAAVA
jgi:glutamyl-tRNA reductase